MTATFDAHGLVRLLRAAGLTAAEERPLGALTTYGVGGAARCAVQVDSDDDARRVAAVLANTDPVEVLVVGRGSNLLVGDGGFDGVAVLTSTGPSGDVDVSFGDGFLTVPGRMPMPVLARRAAARGCGGLEWAVGIPGSVGGAVRMNAGGHGSDMEASLVSARLLSLRSAREREVDAAALGLHFRGSVLGPTHLVLSASLGCVPVDPEAALADLASIVAWRRENQPGGRNAGSVFVNPGTGGMSAGALVDACGLRGLRVGGAEVSTKHANFILATDGATAGDIVGLMTRVQDEVRRVHGVDLRSEVRLVGFDDDTTSRFSDPRHRAGGLASAAGALRDALGEHR